MLQMEMVECGAASLAAILRYHGRVVTLEALRIACNVTRDGTNASNIVQAARAYGLKAKGFRKSIEKVREVSFPVIIHWNFNHFLVLEGFRKDRAYVSDPALGRYSVSMGEFEEAFTGVVLAFEPGPEFRRSDAQPGLLAGLAPRLRHSKKALGFVLLASLALVVPGLAVPAFTRIFIDQYLIERIGAWIPGLLLVMALFVLLTGALTWVQQRHLLRLETKLALSSSGAFLWHILHLPIAFFTQRSGGEVGARVAINDRVARLLSGELATTLLSTATAAFYLVLMLVYDVALTLLSLVVAALNLVGLLLVSRRRKQESRLLQQELGKLVGTTQVGMRQIETLKASGLEADFFVRWAGYFAKTLNAEQRLGTSTRMLGTLPFLLTSLNTAVVLAYGSLRVMDGHLTIGTLIAFQYLMINFMLPVERLVQVGDLLQTTAADMDRLDDVLRYPRAPEFDRVRDTLPPEARPAEAVKLSGALELRNVTFGYSRIGPPLVEGFDLKIPAGGRVALVGGSGSGKSTLARLVCGLFEPFDGEILFDGRPRRAWPRRLLTASLTLVDQDLLFFADTVRANLSLWDATLPFSRIQQAAKDACIHDDIAARPGAYDSPIREGGRNFSGGQRQRLEIARALAQEPTLLVLDEATSALDPVTEQRIMDNIRRRGCTCLIVAHRLSTIRDCDEIIVLEAGQVVQRGAHETLAQEDGAYVRLIEAGAVAGLGG